MRFNRSIVALAAALLLASPASAQNTRAPAGRAPAQRILSPRDTAHLAVGGRRVFVDYGRPLMRGRRIMGELVPWGRPWRTGANAATTLVTDVDLVIGGTLVPRGTYTLYTLPAPNRWTLIVNRQTGQWGTQYDASRDLARIPMVRSTLPRPVEQFTIALVPAQGNRFDLVMEWEHTRVSVPVRMHPGAAARVRR